jgi:hypothetical protein
MAYPGAVVLVAMFGVDGVRLMRGWQATSVITGEGLYEGLAWVRDSLAFG